MSNFFMPAFFLTYSEIEKIVHYGIIFKDEIMRHTVISLFWLSIPFTLTFCERHDNQFLFHHEISEREKNLDFCVINKIHKNESNLISYSKTGHKNLSDTTHITYFKVRFHMNRGVEIEKEDSIAFFKKENGHWHCEDCPGISHMN
jgi:hypothetical protein